MSIQRSVSSQCCVPEALFGFDVCRCNLDRSYFGKIFKETVLATPQEYIIRYRVNKACELMNSTELSIGDISARVGYENQLHFSRAFKRVMGMPPTEWKKRNRKA